MMRKSLVRLSLSLMFLAGAVATSPSAEASCENQWTSVTTYYAYVVVSHPSSYYCSIPPISPPCPSCYSWQPIGEIVFSACDGNSTWGDTTTCTGSANVQYSNYVCDVICDS